ncbi:MAG: hypothetical protein IT515_06135 [Burkholderiales bacterium]|nr:hypothetical protein [Burkholderiales bacterium]
MAAPRFRRYALSLLAGILGALALVGLFNRIVDPFGYYRDVSIQGFNAVKTKFGRFERHVKPSIVAREKPEAIIFGSSLAEIGFDPSNPYFTDHGRLTGYNFGIAGAWWDKVQCYFEFALRHDTPRRIILGINLVDMPLVDCTEQVAAMGKPDLASLLFSASAFRASVRTVLEQRRGRPSHTLDGRFFYGRGQGAAERSFVEMFARRLRGTSCPLRGLDAMTAARAPVASPRRTLDLAGLRQVVREAVARGIELKLVVYPQHAYNLELDALCGADVDRWDALDQMARAVAAASEGSNLVQLWEFLTYDDVTGEPVSPDMKLWQDSQHFNVEVGDLMLAAMFDRHAPGGPSFGRRVVPGSQDEARRRFDADRDAFIDAHPWFYPGLRKLVPR